MKNIKTNFRLTPWLLATTFSITLAACGGGGQETILGTGDIAPVVPPVVVLAPTVTVVTPFAGALNVAPNTKTITAVFSKAMDSATLTNASFTLACPLATPITGGTVSYLTDSKMATLPLLAALPAATVCTATITTAAKDNTGLNLASNYAWEFTTGESTDTTAPTVTLVNPANAATGVATNTAVNATFSEAMDPLTVKATSFTLTSAGVPVAGTISVNPLNTVATFTPGANLAVDTSYTATVSTDVTDQAGNPLTTVKAWTFTTAAAASAAPLVALNMAQPFGTFGGTAGMTNMGINTIVNGDIGTIATGSSMITGFHDASNIYTETPDNIGNVTGKIYTCTNSTTGTNAAGPSAPDCALATQARLDAQTAYLALAAMPVLGASPAPGANLAGVTLLPGTYKAAGGSFMIQGGNLTLDAQGDANATWVFQMASTLTIGGPGAAAPQSIILAGGALAKNVFWQVGTAATINAAGGGTVVGTVIAQDGVSFSTAGQVAPVTLNGRALSLGASVTMVNTVINVPAQ
ncbi:MAG: ice-binding family protein [Rhodoferax sp.]|jgi:hypothetical protein|nr:ice-binding family protein [Rhodoferax sp.]